MHRTFPRRSTQQPQTAAEAIEYFRLTLAEHGRIHDQWVGERDGTDAALTKARRNLFAAEAALADWGYGVSYSVSGQVTIRSNIAVQPSAVADAAAVK